MRREFNWRTVRNTALLSAALLSVPPIAHFDTTRRVITGNTDCSSGRGGALSGAFYDTEAIAGGGLMKDLDGRSVPNSASMRRLRAGAWWYIDQARGGHPPTMIALLDGRTTPENRYVTRDTFRKLVWQYSDHTVEVPVENFYLDQETLNTSEGVDKFAESFSESGQTKAALISDESHIGRFTILACARGIPATGMAAEDLLIAHDPSMVRPMRVWRNSPAARKRNVIEFFKRATLPWSPHGELLTLAKRTRNAWNDTPDMPNVAAVPDTSGESHTEDMQVSPNQSP